MGTYSVSVTGPLLGRLETGHSRSAVSRLGGCGRSGAGSGCPRTCPHQTRIRCERRVLGLRVNRRWGLARIEYHLHMNMNISTVHRVLTRYHCPPLQFTDPATGIRVRGRDRARRYEYAVPGEMIHVDIKNLGRIPDGGGHRVHRQVWGDANSRARNLAEGRRKERGQVRGYTFLHHAVDDHSRFVYSEILPDETKETASAFMRNAIAAFADHGVTIQRSLTDNGSCYCFRTFAAVLAEAGISPKRTRPLSTPDQRQGRALKPRPARGMGLRQSLRLRNRTAILLPGLHRVLHATGPTPHSKAPHRSAASPTHQVNTPDMSAFLVKRARVSGPGLVCPEPLLCVRSPCVVSVWLARRDRREALSC
jgi:hypothetical protein